MKQHKVLAAIKIDTFAGRSVLSGIMDHIDANHPWQLRILQNPTDISAEVIREAVADGYDGFLFSFTGDDSSADALRSCERPLVLIGSRKPGFDRRRAPTAFVWTDNESLGETGGNYLTQLGRFNSFAFVHSQSDSPYSCERQRGFATVVSRRTGKQPKAFSSAHPIGSKDDLLALSNWLAALPKPIAVMVACDYRALHVIAAAERAGLTIPGQMSLLGIDNDELIAAHSNPPLSSVQPGHYNMGLRASAELERLMSSRRPSGIRTTLIPALRIVKRESTGFVSPTTSLVDRAKQFIAEHVKDGICVADVVARLGCSRNLADLRYREVEGITIRAAIEEARLDEVKKLLRTTNRPTGIIAKQCGFKSASTLAHVFLKRFGMTMGEWRAQARDAAQPPSAHGHSALRERQAQPTS